MSEELESLKSYVIHVKNELLEAITEINENADILKKRQDSMAVSTAEGTETEQRLTTLERTAQNLVNDVHDIVQTLNVLSQDYQQFKNVVEIKKVYKNMIDEGLDPIEKEQFSRELTY